MESHLVISLFLVNAGMQVVRLIYVNLISCLLFAAS